jgi:hypothetical protein
MITKNATFESIRLGLLPKLKKPDGTPGLTLISDELQVGLVLAAIDEEISITRDDLEEWGVTFDEAYAAALENLLARSSRNQLQDVDTVPGMAMYLPGRTDAASRALVLQDLLDVFPAEGVLFAVPTTDQLLLIPLHDMESLSAIRVLVTATHLATQNCSHPLSNQLFWTDGDEITHIQVVHETDNVDILAPPEFLAAVERLASMSMVAVAGEA